MPVQGRSMLLQLLVGAASVVAFSLPTHASAVDREEPRTQVRVLAVAQADGRAVIQLDSGTPVTLSTGDPLADDRYTLQAVRADHVVLQDRAPSGERGELWVWVVDAQGHSRTRRIDRSSGPVPRVRKSEIQKLSR